MYCKNRSYTTTDYRDWSCQFFHKIETEDNIKALKELREAFNEDTDAYEVFIETYVPKKILYTKAGKLSARDFDRSNIEKPIIDLLFFPKYFKEPSPYGCKNLNIDDRFIIDCRSKKKASDGEGFELKIHIKIVSNEY